MAGNGILQGIDSDRIESWINSADITTPPLTAPRPPDSVEVPSQETVLSPSNPANPRNWSSRKKWCTLLSLMIANLGANFAAAGFVPAMSKFREDFAVSVEVATLGWTVYVIGLALGPLVLAPASEFFGRRKVFIVSYLFFFFLILGTALVQNIGGFITLRVLSGFFASVATANIAGTISDLWHVRDSGIPLSVFVWVTLVGSPFGYFVFSFIAENYDWRHIFWALLGISGGALLLMTLTLFIVGESCHTTVAKHLSRRTKSTNENVGRIQRLSRSEKTKNGIRKLFQQALPRPFRFLFREWIIIFATLYIGYIFGLAVLFSLSLQIVFGDKHNFSTVGLSYAGIWIGVTCGPLTNFVQELYYQKVVLVNAVRLAPKASNLLSKIAAITLPLSLFGYGWTTYASIHWIVPILASSVWGWSFYTLVLMVFTYTVNSYGQLSASALAAVCLLGNIIRGTFPLFGRQMFTYAGFGGLDGLSTQEASTILACLALVIVPAPFLLDRYGGKLKDRSPWAAKQFDETIEQETAENEKAEPEQNENIYKTEMDDSLGLASKDESETTQV